MSIHATEGHITLVNTAKQHIKNAAEQYCKAMDMLLGQCDVWPAKGDNDIPEVQIAHYLGRILENSILEPNVATNNNSQFLDLIALSKSTLYAFEMKNLYVSNNRSDKCNSMACDIDRLKEMADLTDSMLRRLAAAGDPKQIILGVIGSIWIEGPEHPLSELREAMRSEFESGKLGSHPPSERQRKLYDAIKHVGGWPFAEPAWKCGTSSQHWIGCVWTPGFGGR